MRELIPGLFHWTARHPNIGQDVSSHYLRDAATVLDPLAPAEGIDAVAELGPVEHVVLSCRHHDRDHAAFVEQFGADFHVNENGTHEYPGEEAKAYAIGDTVVPGITAVANGPIAPDDSVLRLDVEGGALLFADSLLTAEGELSFMPDSLLGDDPDQVRADITAALQELLDTQEFDHLLFAHGEPIVGGGREQLEAFVQKAR
jgi:hypothetical protein